MVPCRTERAREDYGSIAKMELVEMKLFKWNASRRWNSQWARSGLFQNWP